MDDLDRLISKFSPEQQRAVHERVEQLVMAHNLRELRALAKRTQKDVSEATGFKQNNVSRLEKKGDMKLSTLRDYVESLGGKLRITADLDGKRVDLTAIVSRSAESVVGHRS